MEDGMRLAIEGLVAKNAAKNGAASKIPIRFISPTFSFNDLDVNLYVLETPRTRTTHTKGYPINTDS